LIVLDDIKPGRGPYDWSLTQLDRARAGGTLADWFSLPWGGPEVVMLPGFHTPAENGFRKASAATGDLFLTLCGLMSCGTRTVLVSRWRVAGQTSFDLVREFAQELPHASPAEAWQRSVQIAGGTPIELAREPRIKKVSGPVGPLKASHPFFWSGYMLVDSGTRDPQRDALPGAALPEVSKPARQAQPANPRVVPAPPRPAP
jgi:hypothetical protein